MDGWEVKGNGWSFLPAGAIADCYSPNCQGAMPGTATNM
jgi:hypothetical protein